MTSIFKQTTSKSLGKLLSYHNITSGIQAETTYAKFKVVVYTNSIFRISATVDEHFEDFSYALVAKPDGIQFEIIESETHLVSRPLFVSWF